MFRERNYFRFGIDPYPVWFLGILGTQVRIKIDGGIVYADFGDFKVFNGEYIVNDNGKFSKQAEEPKMNTHVSGN
jgi:hypothetical protein